MIKDGIEIRDEERTRCEVWSRVMGYHRPVVGWNPGKQAEFAERKSFTESKAMEGVSRYEENRKAA